MFPVNKVEDVTIGADCLIRVGSDSLRNGPCRSGEHGEDIESKLELNVED